jgi:ribonucleoside-diphosphate reductase alpha chain
MRPQVLTGVTHALTTSHGNVHVTVNYSDNTPYEVFVHLGKAGSEERALTEAIGRLLSTSLQAGTSLDKLCKQLRGISSEQVYGFGPNKVLSVPDAVGIILQKHLGGTGETDSEALGVGSYRDPATGRVMQVNGAGLRTA